MTLGPQKKPLPLIRRALLQVDPMGRQRQLEPVMRSRLPAMARRVYESQPVRASDLHHEPGHHVCTLAYHWRVAPNPHKLSTLESLPTIENLVNGTMLLHNHTGFVPLRGTKTGLLNFLSALQPPASIHLNQNGTMTADQQAGKAVFERPAQCAQCLAGPAFIPPAGTPLAIDGGIGTGLAPANVPSLRGAWTTAPYLNQGQAKTLMDVLKSNSSDAHGQNLSGPSNRQLPQGSCQIAGQKA